MKMLVHTDRLGRQAFGVWWVDPVVGQVQNLYFEPDSAIAARGRVIVFSKTNELVSWSSWFDELTTRQPQFEDWVEYDSMGMTPKEFLYSFTPLNATA